MPINSDIISYTQARNNLKEVMEKVWNDSAPVIITQKSGRHVVVMSKDEYDSMNATKYLLASPANAEDLRQGIKDFEEGKNLVSFTLEEWEAFCANKDN